MAIKQILQIGNPKLKAGNKQVVDYNSKEIKNIIQDLIDTMIANELIGIAAPQIGYNLQVFITNPRETKYRLKDQTDELRVYINPQIIYYSLKKQTAYEGCGCTHEADLMGLVTRSQIVKVEACDTSEKQFLFKCDGILARLIQHEQDHLNGKEYIDLVIDKKFITHQEYIDKYKNSENQRLTSLITIKEFKFIN